MSFVRVEHPTLLCYMYVTMEEFSAGIYGLLPRIPYQLLIAALCRHKRSWIEGIKGSTYKTRSKNINIPYKFNLTLDVSMNAVPNSRSNLKT